MQKYIGLSLSTLGAIILSNITLDWKIGIAALLIGIGGVIYGDAE